MKISVIIPTFNRARTLCRAIDSVLSQDYKAFELIVVDDCSQDETKDLLKKYKNKIKTIFLNKNKGVSYARNLGVEVSCGDWVSFLDSDDEWLEGKLSSQVEFIEKNKNLKIVHGEEIWVRNGVRVNQKKIHKKYGGDIFNHCISLCVISPSTVMIEKNIYQENEGFNENYPVCEDYEFWLRLASQYKVGFVEEPIIIKYGGYEDQLSKKYKAMDYWRVKALDSIFDSKNIKESSKKKVQESILKKTQILINGYVKHNNLDRVDEVKTIRIKHLPC